MRHKVVDSVSQIPGDKSLDSTLALAFEGYEFISKRCRRYKTDVFQTRLMLRKFICMSGEEAAQVFYDEDRFERRAAAAERVKQTLFGQAACRGWTAMRTGTESECSCR